MYMFVIMVLYMCCSCIHQCLWQWTLPEWWCLCWQHSPVCMQLSSRLHRNQMWNTYVCSINHIMCIVYSYLIDLIELKKIVKYIYCIVCKVYYDRMEKMRTLILIEINCWNIIINLQISKKSDVKWFKLFLIVYHIIVVLYTRWWIPYNVHKCICSGFQKIKTEEVFIAECPYVTKISLCKHFI